ncbi:MAG: pyrimidine/purine nucleoside phosphorylase [Gammaproteobacteria bacterium]|nr:pyrimidine/purine nucleoside phosphorylase [Pseudomonadales bacterium]MCP5348063.1 pyrimidine/purine nucleoside phosphorylase [Pseudomonadales bacterium]
MTEFKDATISRLANVYFDGQVTSRTVTLADGEKKTLGIMLPGTYRFTTDTRELMEIQSGHVEVRLDGQDEWQSYQDDSSFEVPGGSAFDIRVNTVTDYCCSYGD